MHVQKNTMPRNTMTSKRKTPSTSSSSSSSSALVPTVSTQVTTTNAATTASTQGTTTNTATTTTTSETSVQVTTTNTAMTTTTSETSVTEKTKGQLNRVTCRQRKEESKGPLKGNFPQDIANFNQETNYADWCLFHSGTACALITLPTCYINAPRTAKGNEKMLEFGQAPQDEQEWCQRRAS